MDASEKIWAWFFVDSKRNDDMQGGWDDKPDRKTTEYIRADIAQAMVAAAYEDAANTYNDLINLKAAAIPGVVKGSVPDEARAALDALLKDEREKALREAAAVARGVGGLPENTGSPPSDFNNEGYNLAANDASDTILALIDKDKEAN